MSDTQVQNKIKLKIIQPNKKCSMNKRDDSKIDKKENSNSWASTNTQPFGKVRKWFEPRSDTHYWKWSSGWLEYWERPLLASDILTTCAEAIFKVKCSISVSWKLKNPCERYLDSEDGFRAGCWNVSHQQETFSGLD